MSNMNAVKKVVDLRRAKGEAARRVLIESAIVVIASRGLDGTTFAAIADESGLSRALVTFHFKTKEQLIAEALSYANDIYEESWNRHVRKPGLAPDVKIATAVAHDVAFVSSHPALLGLWLTTWSENRSQETYATHALDADRAYVAEIAAAFDAATAAQPNQRFSSQAKARALCALLYGVWLDHHVDSRNFNQADVLESFAAVLHGLMPQWSGPFPEIPVEDASRTGRKL